MMTMDTVQILRKSIYVWTSNIKRQKQIWLLELVNELNYLLLDLFTTIYLGLHYVRKHHVWSICSFSLCFERIVSVSNKDKSTRLILSDGELRDSCLIWIDSYSNILCIGSHATILEVYEGQLLNLIPFNNTYTPPINIKTVNAAFANNSENGDTHILNDNQALDFSESTAHSLLCPNQAIMNGTLCPNQSLATKGKLLILAIGLFMHPNDYKQWYIIVTV